MIRSSGVRSASSSEWSRIPTGSACAIGTIARASRIEAQMPAETREIAGLGCQDLTRQGHLGQIILPCDRALARKIAARGQCGDQAACRRRRWEPAGTSGSKAGRWPISWSAPSRVARSGDIAVIRSSASAVHSSAISSASTSASDREDRRKARPGDRSANPPFDGQIDIVARRLGADPQVEIMVRAGSDHRARHRDAELGGKACNRCDLRQGERGADARAGSDLQVGQRRVGRNQAAGMIDPAKDLARFRRRAGHADLQARDGPRDSENRAATSRARPRRRQRRSGRSSAISWPGSAMPSNSPMSASSRAASEREAPAMRRSIIKRPSPGEAR